MKKEIKKESSATHDKDGKELIKLIGFESGKINFMEGDRPFAFTLDEVMYIKDNGKYVEIGICIGVKQYLYLNVKGTIKDYNHLAMNQ